MSSSSSSSSVSESVKSETSLTDSSCTLDGSAPQSARSVDLEIESCSKRDASSATEYAANNISCLWFIVSSNKCSFTEANGRGRLPLIIFLTLTGSCWTAFLFFDSPKELDETGFIFASDDCTLRLSTFASNCRCFLNFFFLRRRASFLELQLSDTLPCLRSATFAYRRIFTVGLTSPFPTDALAVSAWFLLLALTGVISLTVFLQWASFPLNAPDFFRSVIRSLVICWQKSFSQAPSVAKSRLFRSLLVLG